MKRQTLLTLTIAIAMTMTMNAQTIALHSSTGVQIIKGNNALALAYTAAQNGDTLYLSGHTFTPPGAFDKQLTIFGAGHYVDSTLATGKTFINGSVTLNQNADLFYLEGVEITGNFNLAIQPDYLPPTSPSFTDYMYVDFVKVYNLKNDCNTNINVCNYNFNTHDNRVKKNITIGNGSCTNSLTSGSNVYLRASEGVLINGDFTVPVGAELYIDVNSCYE